MHGTNVRSGIYRRVGCCVLTTGKRTNHSGRPGAKPGPIVSTRTTCGLGHVAAHLALTMEALIGCRLVAHPTSDRFRIVQGPLEGRVSIPS